MNLDCVFCMIITGHMVADKVAETEDLIVIKDIRPKCSFHYLIIPKVHYKDLQDADEGVIASLMAMARSLAAENPDIAEYRLVINNGYKAGQRVFHLHVHLLAGQTLPDF